MQNSGKLGIWFLCSIFIILTSMVICFKEETFKNIKNNPLEHPKVLGFEEKPYTVSSRIKKNRKRCRYSEKDIREFQINHDIKRLESNSYYNSKLTSDRVTMNADTINKHHNKQLKTRDQFGNLIERSSNRNSYSINYKSNQNYPNFHNFQYQHQTQQATISEKEIIYANPGERINLTCHIHAREIDWHFKDKNLTTTILSYGLQLQVAQPVMYDTADNSDTFAIFFGADSGIDNVQPQDRLFAPFKRQERLAKYELSSDRHSTHVLSLHVQGSQDEGSYQCVDSKSEVPIKKTIVVYLKNNSRILKSAFNENTFSSLILLCIFTSFIAY